MPTFLKPLSWKWPIFWLYSQGKEDSQIIGMLQHAASGCSSILPTYWERILSSLTIRLTLHILALKYIQCFKSKQSFASTLRKKSQKYSTGFCSHFSTNFGLIWTKWTTNFPSMLNKLGITSGARMARIFMDLLRESESADFPNPWISLPSLHLRLYHAYSTY